MCEDDTDYDEVEIIETTEGFIWVYGDEMSDEIFETPEEALDDYVDWLESVEYDDFTDEEDEE